MPGPRDLMAGRLPDRIVDFHVHLFPDRLFEAIWRHFAQDYGWEVLHRLYWQEVLSYLRERGVGPVVYSNYAHREGIARGLNDWNLQVLETDPDLYCFAAYHPDDRDGPAMARDLLSHPRILGFKLQLLVQRFSPEDRRLDPLYEAVRERHKRILFHVGTGPVGNEFVGVAPFRNLLRRYPDLPANVAHMGALEYGPFLDLLAGHPDLYLDTSFSFLPGLGTMFDLGPEALSRHGDRILYGSDFPNILFPRETEIETLLAHNLPQEVYDRIFRDNGMRLIEAIGQARP